MKQEIIPHYSDDLHSEVGPAVVEEVKALGFEAAVTSMQKGDLYEVFFIQSLISKLISEEDLSSDEVNFATIKLTDRTSVGKTFRESYKAERERNQSRVNIFIVNQGAIHWSCVIIDHQNHRILSFDPLRLSIFESLNNSFRSSEEFKGFQLHENETNFQNGATECGPITIEFVIRAFMVKLWDNNFNYGNNRNLNFTLQAYYLLTKEFENNLNLFQKQEIGKTIDVISLAFLRERQERFLFLDPSQSPKGNIEKKIKELLEWVSLLTLPRREDIQQKTEEELASHNSIKDYLIKSYDVTPGEIDTGTPGDEGINNNIMALIPSKSLDQKPEEPIEVLSTIFLFLKLTLIAFIVSCIQYIHNLPSKLVSNFTIASKNVIIPSEPQKVSVMTPKIPKINNTTLTSTMKDNDKIDTTGPANP